ncbi:hypothetical protein EZX42_11130 [Salmonella enterica subsp. enterica serovar Reading]|nr:hypothetical protein [Salmonella enterica subsp. enterica serovar Reading]
MGLPESIWLKIELCCQWQRSTKNDQGCIQVFQKACWLKNNLCCQWQHGTKNDQRLYLGLPESVLVKK